MQILTKAESAKAKDDGKCAESRATKECEGIELRQRSDEKWLTVEASEREKERAETRRRRTAAGSRGWRTNKLAKEKEAGGK